MEKEKKKHCLFYSYFTFNWEEGEIVSEFYRGWWIFKRKFYLVKYRVKHLASSKENEKEVFYSIAECTEEEVRPNKKFYY